MRNVLLSLFILFTSVSLVGCEEKVNVKEDPMSLASELLFMIGLTEVFPDPVEGVYEEFTALYGEDFKVNATKEKLQSLINVYGSSSGSTSELAVLTTLENGVKLKIGIYYNKELDEYEIYDVQVVE